MVNGGDKMLEQTGPSPDLALAVHAFLSHFERGEKLAPFAPRKSSICLNADNKEKPFTLDFHNSLALHHSIPEPGPCPEGLQRFFKNEYVPTFLIRLKHYASQTPSITHYNSTSLLSQ